MWQTTKGIEIRDVLEQRRKLAAALETLTGSQPSLVEVEKARRTGELVTQHGYKLSWSVSQNWVVQLPLDFPEIWAPTRLPFSLTGTVRLYGSTGTQT
jgi:hypothetical protein